MNRKQAHAIYHQLYTKKYPVIDAELCQYCGVDIDLSVDHVPAITTAQLYSTRKDIDFMLVCSCMECNILLSNDLLPLFNDRFFTVKERLLNKYKKDLINEFRNGLIWDTAYLQEADQKFFKTLDRIGFGLVRFGDLGDEAQQILDIKIDSYDQTIGDLVAYRTGGGLLKDDNTIDDMDEEPDFEYCGYSKFLQIINFKSISSHSIYESWISENFSELKDYLLPEYPSSLYNKSWREMWDEASQLIVDAMPAYIDERDYCNFDEFITVLNERGIFTQSEYNSWYTENLWGAVIALDMPEAPEHIYKVNWKHISTACKNVEEDTDIIIEEGGYPEHVISKLDTFESLLTDTEIDNDSIMHKRRFVIFLEESLIDTYEEYKEFYDIVKYDVLSVHMPVDPKKDYSSWNLEHFYSTE